MMNVVENENYILVYEDNELVPMVLWTYDQKQRYLLNSKVRNLLCVHYQRWNTQKCMLLKVHAFKGINEMLHTLVITYDGSIEVRRNKLKVLLLTSMNSLV